MISVEGQNLKRIRESKGIGITELSKKAKVGIATISELERGIRRRSSIPTLTKLANVLGVTVNDLLGIEENIQYEIIDIEEMFKVILDANDMEIDGVVLSDDEKKCMDIMFNTTLSLIRQRRQQK